MASQVIEIGHQEGDEFLPLRTLGYVLAILLSFLWLGLLGDLTVYAYIIARLAT